MTDGRNTWNLMTNKADIIIIGGGAAGLMAAAGAAEFLTVHGNGEERNQGNGRARVVVLEKMARPGRKIMITGKGRCNFTNVKQWNEFQEHIHPKPNFLKPSFYNLTSEKMLGFLEEHGMPYVVERGDRAFPESHLASDVVDALVRAAEGAGAEIFCGAEVKEILRCAQDDMSAEWKEAIEKAAKDGDSLGAVVECCVPNIDPGYGEPFWDSVESQIAHAVFAIPGVRGVEFGDGFKAAAMRGSEHNDPIGPDARPTKNGAGGVNGGLTNGAPVVFRVAFKPTSSISRAQQTFNFETGEMDTLEIKGRHDVCYALRCPVVVEAMTAIVLADFVLLR